MEDNFGRRIGRVALGGTRSLTFVGGDYQVLCCIMLEVVHGDFR
jgi:hypothetical protein